MKKIIIASLTAFLLLSCATSNAKTLKPEHSENLAKNPKITSLIKEMHDKYDFNEAKLTELFSHVKLRPKVIKAMNKPYEGNPWFIYKDRFVTQKRAEAGVKFWNEHAHLLQDAQERYGVPADIIVSIIGVESNFGTHLGDYKVLDTLTTFYVDYPKRAKFFRKELVNYLLLARENNWDPAKMTGSYAGAMGKPQFMPSSYRHYAVDCSHSGSVDLLNDNEDIICSVANYLKENGWKANKPIATRAIITKPKLTDDIPTSRKPNLTLAKLQKDYGVKTDGNFKKSTKAIFLPLKTEDKTGDWVGFHNFYVITRYNTSKLYAMAVYQLGQKMAKIREQESA